MWKKSSADLYDALSVSHKLFHLFDFMDIYLYIKFHPNLIKKPTKQTKPVFIVILAFNLRMASIRISCGNLKEDWCLMKRTFIRFEIHFNEIFLDIWIRVNRSHGSHTYNTQKHVWTNNWLHERENFSMRIFMVSIFDFHESQRKMISDLFLWLRYFWALCIFFHPYYLDTSILLRKRER